jgi:hypothetical protein
MIITLDIVSKNYTELKKNKIYYEQEKTIEEIEEIEKLLD